jgi:HD-GYP domain-containing protein (c-di-GMP phosphodiesterase class II)
MRTDATLRAGPDALPVLRRRCRDMGLPTWRCDTQGQLLSEPSETGLLGLWLASPPVGSMVSDAARRWNAAAVPEPTEVFPGCWLIPVPEEHRRKRVGYVVAMALCSTAPASTQFETTCARAQLDPRAVGRAIAGIASFQPASARSLASAVVWMMDDLSGIAADRQTVDGFAHQLSDSYETIDLLYSLGRAMHDLTKPDQFVTMLGERLHSAMSFAWLALYVGPDRRLPPTVSDRLLMFGKPPSTLPEVRAACEGLIGRPDAPAHAYIADELPGLSSAAPTQIIVQPVLYGRGVAALVLAGDKSGHDPQVNSYETQLIEAAAGYLGAFIANVGLYADQQAMFMGTLRAMTASIDAKDPYTCGHSERVAHLGARLALAVGWDKAKADRLHICGLVHDVGKIGVPEAVLGKPGRLTDEEFEAIKKHPEIGYRILKDIPLLEDVLPGVLHHHERYDGKGYPHRLAGEQIPLAARLLALADTFDAMSSTRSYRAAMPREKVLAEIQRCAGSQFDPSLAGVFVGLDFTTYDRMVAEHAERYRPVQHLAA